MSASASGPPEPGTDPPPPEVRRAAPPAGPADALRRPSDLARELRGSGSSRPRPGARGAPPAGPADPPLPWPGGFAEQPRDRAALLVLLSLASMTPRRLLELAQDAPVASACLDAVRDGAAGSERDRDLARSLVPGDLEAGVAASGTRLVAVHDAEYPLRLLDLFDPPAGLFVRGATLEGGRRCVAIVGARNATAGGLDLARTLGRALGHAGVCVVSGAARGIDAAAHRGSLDAGGDTVAVLGSGIDRPYPRSNAGLIAAIARAGSVVSEYPPGTRAEPFRFPARNRIVAALAEAVVVVEGATGSGSMISAEHALDLGREVFAVPGAPWSDLAAVPLELIREGAGVVRGPDDLLGDLGLPTAGDALAAGADAAAPAGLSPAEEAVWRALSEPAPPDRVASATRLPLTEVLGALAALEVAGAVLGSGGRYQRRVGWRPGRRGPAT